MGSDAPACADGAHEVTRGESYPGPMSRRAPLSIRRVDYHHPDGAGLTEQVQAYYAEIYGGPDTSPVEVDEFAPPQGAFFIGYADDVPVAMGGWRFIAPLPAFAATRPVEIKRMYVVAQARGRGHAREVLAHLEATAHAAGADAVVLETGEVQADAIALYRSSGYADIAHFGHYADAPLAVHLGKFLR